MAIRDLKRGVEKLENLLNVNQDIPAQWALAIARADICPVESYRTIRTEEQILQEALVLTRKYGSRENYDEAFLRECQQLDQVGFMVRYANPCAFPEKEGQCDICEAVLTDKAADFCQSCHDKHPEKVNQIIEYRKNGQEPESKIFRVHPRRRPK